LEPNATAFAAMKNDEAAFGNLDCDLNKIDGAVHLVGIGGIGMSALARLLLGRGIAVSGSDKAESEILKELEGLGATISVGHNVANIKKAAAIAVSTAITADNPEIKYAREHNLPIWHRSQLLAALTAGKRLVAVSGTHGKTTTTGMIGQVLLDCDLDPSIVVGGIFNRIGSNARSGKSDYFVAESDESDGTHANLDSYFAVLTNLESDHLENYPGGFTQIQETMLKFLNHAREEVVVCADDAGCKAIMPRVLRKVTTYGVSQDATYRLENLAGFKFRVFREGKVLGEVTLAVPGEHNKLNALAAIAVGMELGLEFAPIAKSLAEFRGVDRRFQIIGEAKDILVVDDYAHHPTEVQATLKAARQYIEQCKLDGKRERRLVALFQPHQPGRLRDFWDEFLASFKDADLVLIADVYIARGAAIPGIDSNSFVSQLSHKDAHYLGGSVHDLPEKVVPYLKPNDLVLTIGAGDVTGVGPELLKKLTV
jgi:UDP-N-acetylmuramate--alanine ligase